MARAHLAAGLLLTVTGIGGCASEPLADEPAIIDDGGPPTTDGAPSQPADGYALVEYPPGPYGRGVGSVIENLEFLGWRDPVAAGYDPERFEVVRLSDFYDADGSQIRYIMLNASAVWCTVCRAEYRHLESEGINAEFGPRGVQLLGALFEDAEAGPARPEDLAEWGSLPAHSVEFPLLLDPGFKLGAYFTSDATPLNLLIDARTMRIVDATMGYDPSPDSSYWRVIDSLLASP
jgi:hypothetical protein